MMKIFKRLTLLLILLNFNTAFAQENWELKKNENGIKVYTRKPKDDKYKEIKVTCELEATPEQLITVLQDVANHSKWVYGTKKTYLVKNLSSTKLIYYSETDMPWPVTNRDLVVELEIIKGTANNQFEIKATSIPNYLSPKADLIRVPYSLALWQVAPSENKLKIEYTFSVNPGGAIPAWVVNMAASVGPYKSFLELKKILKSDKYKKTK